MNEHDDGLTSWTLIYGDRGLMELSAHISQRVPAHDIMIERHETAWGERYKMARYTCQDSGATLAHVEWVDEEIADQAWAEAVTALLLDRLERKVSGVFFGMPVINVPATTYQNRISSLLAA
ncbi:hypothetical protein ABZ714_13150 [Streptomyces sp. NPDC006798]|uniref:hypothetical protein n=1 Tax=Streptomyces sp. NPDC006798 TaxID=3155462 RepID=UPI0033F82409